MKKLQTILFYLILPLGIHSQDFNNVSIKEVEILEQPQYKRHYKASEYKVKGDSLLVIEYFSNYDYYGDLTVDSIFSDTDTIIDIRFYTRQSGFNLSKQSKKWELGSPNVNFDVFTPKVAIKFPSFPCNIGAKISIPCWRYEFHGLRDSSNFNDSISRTWTLIKIDSQRLKDIKAGAKNLITNIGLCVEDNYTIYNELEKNKFELWSDVEIQRFDIQFDNVKDEDFNVESYSLQEDIDKDGNKTPYFVRKKRSKKK